MQRALQWPAVVNCVNEWCVGQAALRAALARLPKNELPTCRTASTATLSQGVAMGAVTNPRLEVEHAIFDTRKQLDDLLESAAL